MARLLFPDILSFRSVYWGHLTYLLLCQLSLLSIGLHAHADHPLEEGHTEDYAYCHVEVYLLVLQQGVGLEEDE